MSLSGRFVRIEPLEPRHFAGLARTIEPGTFRFFPHAPEADEASVAAWFERMREAARQPFAILCAGTGEVAGSSSYLDVRPHDHCLEIGYSWLASRHRGTAINPEAKLLLIAHAFEDLGCRRVQLKTDARNLQSQAAIAKLGAVREGVLRSHMTMPDGHQRDTVMYSIIQAEWPSVRDGLLARLATFDDRPTGP